ncbi:MAG: flavin-containing monooxygenase [Pseudomonadota bacterium]
MEHFDVVVVGAGISGIGAGYHLKDKCPDRTCVILEGRDDIGGTWDLFRYPGIRSDSDMYTLGYSFKPWTDPQSIADGPAILSYLNETADEFDLRRHIRFGHYVKRAAWSTADGLWTVDVEQKTGGGKLQFTCNFLFMCSGYYDYSQGFMPEFEGAADFKGQLIHPQHWPADLNYRGKQVVVIGSGATAVTIVPEMAREAAKVTMLQRTPTYMVWRPGGDPMAEKLRQWFRPRFASTLIRWRNILFGMYFFRLCRKQPEKVKTMLLNGVREQLPDVDINKHFTPPYKPWDQRLCLVRDGDLFEAVRENRATIVTDEIDHFTAEGIRLKSGETLAADIIVSATGLNMQLMSNLEILVDARPVKAADSLSYKGMMFSDIPNLAASFGYTNASWTLKCDLTCEYVCKLLNYMKKHGFTQCLPARPAAEVATAPFIDFSSGYVKRAMDQFPKQGREKPWKVYQNYMMDKLTLGLSGVDDGVMQFSGPGSAGPENRNEQKALTEPEPLARTA